MEANDLEFLQKEILEKYNKIYPIVFFGKSGTGKTSLLNLLYNIYKQESFTKYRQVDSCKVISAETFFKEYQISLKEIKLFEFRKKMRSYDALFIDGFEFLYNKNDCQKELYLTLNALKEIGSIIVIASNDCINKIPKLIPELRNFLSQGLQIDVTSFVTKKMF